MTFYKRAKPYNRSFSLYIVLVIIEFLLATVTPFINSLFIDNLISNKSIRMFIYLISFFFIAYCLEIVISYISSLSLTKLQANVAFDYTKEILGHIQAWPMLEVLEIKSAEMTTIVNEAVNDISYFFIGEIPTAIVKMVFIIIQIALIYKINKRILLFVIGLAIINGIVYSKLKDRLYFSNIEEREKGALFFEALVNQLKYIRQIKIRAKKIEQSHSLTVAYENYLQAAIKFLKNNLKIDSIATFFTQSGNLFILITCGLLVLKGNITLGELTMVTAYSGFLSDSIIYYLEFSKTIQSIRASQTILNRIYEIPRSMEGEIILDTIETISIKNLNFAFDKPLFSNFSLELNPGQFYCLKGDNGTGKTTLSYILLGFYKEQVKNHIYINDIPIEKINTNELRRNKIGYVEQTPVYEDHKLYNIVNRAMNKDYDQLIEEFVTRHKISTDFFDIQELLSFKFNELSQGQRQHFAIIIALLKNPDLLILDEPTSALDHSKKVQLLDILKTISREKICVVISHDSLILKSNCRLISLK